MYTAARKFWQGPGVRLAKTAAYSTAIVAALLVPPAALEGSSASSTSRSLKQEVASESDLARPTDSFDRLRRAGNVASDLISAVLSSSVSTARCEGEGEQEGTKRRSRAQMFSEEELAAAQQQLAEAEAAALRVAAEGEGAPSDSSSRGSEDGEGEVGGDEAGPPQDFDDSEYMKSFQVQEQSGLMLMMIPTIGRMERERMSVGVQMMVDKTVNTVFLLGDERKRPSTNTTVQPSPDGRVIRVSTGTRVPGWPLQLTGELSMGWGRIYGGGVGAKLNGPDFASSLNLKNNQAGKNIEFTYHQTVFRSLPVGSFLSRVINTASGAANTSAPYSLGSLSLGGTLAAQVGGFFPYPIPQTLIPTVFGVYTGRDKEWSVLAKWSKENDSVQAIVHRQINKNLEAGVRMGLNLGTLESTLNVGTRMSIGHDPAIQGPALTLTANAGTDMKVGLGLQHFYVTPFSQSQMVSGINAVMDHRAKEHTIGCTLQFVY
jgi:hypothetical protein